LHEAEELANAGRLSEAAMLCESLLRTNTTWLEAHFLLGVVRDALGDFESAAGSYRKTLFLQPDHAEAMMHLAVLMDRAGDGPAASRLRDRAKRAAGGGR
jgi:chemotaxis protein methyltransferase WspC